MRKYLQALRELCTCFCCLARYPVQFGRIALHLHNTVKGIIFADQFPPTRDNGLLSSKRVSSPTEVNRLEKYFENYSEGPGIWKWRHYLEVYDRHLRKFVGSEVNLAEVGIFGGGSLGMWLNYFGPQCHVFGIDIQEACKRYEQPNVRVFIGDQANRSFWKDFKAEVPVLDILIDDGGHQSDQQIVTLEEILPHLQPGGVFICEDVHGRYNGFDAYMLGLVHELNAASYEPNAGADLAYKPTPFQKFIYSIHHYPFITVIEKQVVPIERLVAPKHGSQWQPF